MPSISRVYTNKNLKQERHPPDIMDDEMDSPPDIMDDILPSDKSEIEFQDWYKQQAQRHNLNSNPEGQFYDYRKAFGERATPDASGHWPSKFKQPGHPNEFVGGYSTITGEPNRNQRQETDVNKLVELGYDPETAKQLSDKNKSDGFIKSAWDAITTPLTNMPSRIIDEYANQIDKPSLERSPMRARIEGFGAGMLEGGGDLIDEMTSPLGIATIAGPKAIGSTIKAGVKGAGAIAETAGKVLKNYPLSGWMPGSRFLVPQNIKNIERSVARGLESVGKRMRGDRIKTINGEVVGPVDPPFVEGQIIESPIKQLPPSKVGHYMNEGQELTKSAPKIKVRPNRDGTFTNMSTGEVLDSSGNPLPIRVGDAITKDSPFFVKNRR